MVQQQVQLKQGLQLQRMLELMDLPRPFGPWQLFGSCAVVEAVCHFPAVIWEQVLWMLHAIPMVETLWRLLLPLELGKGQGQGQGQALAQWSL